MTYSCREKLTLALDAALTARSASALSQLLDSHGSFIFALALAALSSRKMAEVLFMLATAERADAYRRLSHDDRARLAQVGMVNPNDYSSTCWQQSFPHPAIPVSGRVEKLPLPSRPSHSLFTGAST